MGKWRREMNDGKKERERKMGEMYQIKVNTGSRAHVIYKKKKKFKRVLRQKVFLQCRSG